MRITDNLFLHFGADSCSSYPLSPVAAVVSQLLTSQGMFMGPRMSILLRSRILLLSAPVSPSLLPKLSGRGVGAI
jgi:hypothetical protein